MLSDADGQFADRWAQYKSALYYANNEERQIALRSKQDLQDSGMFDKDIVVEILPVQAFYEAEDYHQAYYKKNAWHYTAYNQWSGRAWFLEKHWHDTNTRKTRKDKKPKDASQLTPQQHKILFECATEPPFANAYRDNKAPWIYVDVIDWTPLFSSLDKFDSWTWRPSFTRPIDEAMIQEFTDSQFGMMRTEVKSASSWHLWHVFDDGPEWKPRYCINSAWLEFIPLDAMEAMGYGEYLPLFWRYL
jgi:peptide methionine sulfoxide reductase msrA/msrB